MQFHPVVFLSFPRRRESIVCVQEFILKKYYVYILSNKKNGTLYVGVTSDLIKRIYQHKDGSIEGFTKKYDLKRLVYFEEGCNVNEAIKREKQLKK